MPELFPQRRYPDEWDVELIPARVRISHASRVLLRLCVSVLSLAAAWRLLMGW